MIPPEGRHTGWRHVAESLVHMACLAQQLVLIFLAWPTLNALLAPLGQDNAEVVSALILLALGLFSLFLCETLNRVARRSMKHPGFWTALWEWNMAKPPLVIISPGTGSDQPAHPTPVAKSTAPTVQ